MPSRPPSRLALRFLLRAGLFFIGLLIAAAGWAGFLQYRGNFHPVRAGEMYRSAQPSPEALTNWAGVNGIRSVVNLRGASDSDWYRDEIATSKRLGLAHADFRMSAGEHLTPARANELLALLDSMPGPVLIHCKSGADRTGLASALWLARHGGGEEAAESQISFRFGHVSLPLTAAWPMDQSWEALEPEMGFAS
ncbi:protein tyrosine phosphatase [Paracoccus suum]|uniref:Protein tyrosine phosphatase n=1 Tax=Paracoccus suum TaxID=2259340 RepID=A0A344PNQ6_9RHOB|nr:tyrosine-protein phosphatase [Paracoccus suum]AXC51011.1 protein tyrosine phosphatase [Paracoccus suum]